MKKVHVFVVALLCLCADATWAQSIDSMQVSIKEIPQKYYAKVDKKITSVGEQLTKKSIKYLAKFQKQEARLERKMQQLHPEFAIDSAKEKYSALAQKIKIKAAPVNKIAGGEYNAYLDSLGTSLSFLKQVNGISDKVRQPLASFNQLQDKLQESEKIKAFIAERKNQVKEMLSNYTNLPGGLKRQYDKLSKSAYYYSSQVAEYKALLKEPEKVEQKVLSILNKVPAFEKFWQKNSMWTQLFPVSENAGTTEVLYGLQTREQLKSDLHEKLGISTINLTGNAGNAGSGYLQQQMQQVQTQLAGIKNKLSQFSGGNSLNMPDFKPNTQHTKPLLKRLYLGTNIQNSSSGRFLPAISTISLNIGYKLSDKASVGIGMNYLVGWGSGINNIHFSSQGIGAKSFMDLKLKGNFWVTGGIECNYLQQFAGVQDIKNLDVWQKSALLGITKKYKIGKKEHNVQLLYDFLARTEIPAGEPFKFRIGWQF